MTWQRIIGCGVAGFAVVAAFSYWRQTPCGCEARSSAAQRRAEPASPPAGPPIPPSSVHDAGTAAIAAAPSLPSPELVATIRTRLVAWEDNDDPNQRDARIAAMDRLFTDGGRRPMRDRLTLLEALPAQQMDFAFGLPSFQTWMFAEPTAALEWMRTHDGISHARVLTVFQRWQEREPDALRRYIDQLPPGPWKELSVMTASYAAMPADPGAAIGWTQQLPKGQVQTSLLNLATAEWARRDPIAAGDWVNGIVDLSTRNHLIGALAIGYAHTEPALAADWILTAIPPSSALNYSVTEITHLWAKADASAATAWIAQLPQGEVRERALNSFISTTSQLPAVDHESSQIIPPPGNQ